MTRMLIDILTHNDRRMGRRDKNVKNIERTKVRVGQKMGERQRKNKVGGISQRKAMQSLREIDLDR